MTTPRYFYTLVEGTYVGRYDEETRAVHWLKPDGTWEECARSTEICTGRPLRDEQHAFEVLARLNEEEKQQEAAKRGGS